MRKFVVIDDVFDNKRLFKLQSLLDQKNSLPIRFYYKEIENEYKIYVDFLIEIAKDFYDINKYIGYELWSHTDPKKNLEFHYDKDELLFKKNNQNSFPLISIVFYPKIRNLKGGRLYLEKDMIINPKENRLVLFPEGIYHGTSDYNKDGQRISFLINLWDKIPTAYL